MTTEVPADLRRWLQWAIDHEASDLHLVAGHPPTMRRHGAMQGCDESELSSETLHALLWGICPRHAREVFEETKSVDFATQLSVGNFLHRFRVNLFQSDKSICACFRVIPSRLPDFAWAGFPEQLAHKLVRMTNGLILVTGVTGSGKTTTLAMLINLLNQVGGTRIVTVEDPVEYQFPRAAGSIVTQREVGPDVRNFAEGLRASLRQDPDVILVGEIRDRETAAMALSAAETGHLVFSTLHTRDAKGAISRMADLFPREVQTEVRSQLAMSLRAVLSQLLLPGSDPQEKRKLALEVMFNSPAIASAIRFGKIEAIDNAILTGRSDGMITMDESLKRLARAGEIGRGTAERYIKDPAYLRELG